jgi:hypothetical protein
MGLQKIFNLPYSLTTWDLRLYFPIEGRRASDFLSPLKVSSPCPGLNPQTLSPVASTVTTTPPRRLSMELQSKVSEIVSVYTIRADVICGQSNNKKKSKGGVLREAQDVSCTIKPFLCTGRIPVIIIQSPMNYM